MQSKIRPPYGATFAALAFALAALAGCSPTALDTATMPNEAAWRAELADCCEAEGGVPDPVVLFLEQNSADLPRVLRETKVRTAYLEEQEDAQAALLSRLKPMDVIVTRSAARLSGANSYAYFGHAALYVGSETELRAAGVWTHPAVRPHQAAIRAGAVAIEATDTGVHLSAPRELFEADTVAVLRPDGCACACTGLPTAFSMIGRAFDFHLKVDDGDPDLICTELVALALPGVPLPQRELYGHDVILPDEVAAHAIAGRLPLDFVIAIEGFPVGWRLRSEKDIAARILGAYRK